MSDDVETAVLAGGCFWIMQQLLRDCEGVVSTRAVFFQIHPPDLGERLVGSGYRSEILYTSEEQGKVAEETIRDVDASGHWPGKVVTEISEAGPFWEAEDEDQDYFQRYPEGCAAPFPRHGVGAANREPAAELS